MAIAVPRFYQGQFIDLLEQVRSTSQGEALDWEGIRTRMEIDELTIGDWVALMKRIRSLSEPLRKDADRLLHNVQWFAPMSPNYIEADFPEPTPLDADMRLLKNLFSELVHLGFTPNEILKMKLNELENGLEAVRALLDSGWMARRHSLFKPLVERIYNLVLAEGGIGDEARFSAARKAIGSMYEHALKEEAFIDDDERFSTVLPYLHFVLDDHPDPFARYYAVELIARGASRRKFSVLDNDLLTALFESAFHDEEPLVAAAAWKSAYMMNSGFAASLPFYLFAPEHIQGNLSGGVEWKLYHDHWGPLRFRLAEDMLSIRLRDEGSSATMASAEMSINDFIPFHPLRDFDSDVDIRQAVMASKLEFLERLVSEFGIEDKETIMHLFLKEPPTEKSAAHTLDENTWVLRLRSGRHILRQGHHRIAAMIVAVMRGIIPECWLQRIPVSVAPYNGPVPDALLERVFGRGEWEDIFPPEMRANLPQMLRRRSGGSPRGSAPQGPIPTAGAGMMPGAVMSMGAMKMMSLPANINFIQLR